MRRCTVPMLTLAALAAGTCLTEGTPPEPDIVTAPCAASRYVGMAASTRSASGMSIRDLTVGGGAMVANGQLASVRYTGWLVNGTRFDARGPGIESLQLAVRIGPIPVFRAEVVAAR